MEPVIDLFNQHNVRYLVIGGQAVRLEGFPRFTMDWDFYIPRNDLENLTLINRVLEDVIDIPVIRLGPKGQNFVQTYQTNWGVLQFHLAPIGLPEFDEAEKRRVTHRDENELQVFCDCGEDLLACKRTVARDKDADDITFLEDKLNAGTLSAPSPSP